ncbi:hypothetical protein KVA01_23630 [Kocuria varians]|uniref:Transporter YycB n=1 Tax=Kocuria varians TaxID=1272 RepID=A0A4Y4D4S9_KOCVA|nr:MFS transporter [Kocuria varians]GED00209.1 hypothetical protein KVA01_23630 [Kocuria varians]
MPAARPSTVPATLGRGPRAGLLLVGVLLLGANLRAGITAVGPVLPQIEHQVGLSAFQASLLVSLPLVAFAVVSPFAPRIAEALGLERTLGCALAVLAVGIVVRSVPGPGLIWVGTLLLGAAIAVLNVLIPSVIKRDWPQRIGPMTGVYQSVTALTAALASGLVVPVADVVPSGWRLALGMWAGLAVIGLAVFLPWILGRVEGPRVPTPPLGTEPSAPSSGGGEGAAAPSGPARGPRPARAHPAAAARRTRLAGEPVHGPAVHRLLHDGHLAARHPDRQRGERGAGRLVPLRLPGVRARGHPLLRVHDPAAARAVRTGGCCSPPWV